MKKIAYEFPFDVGDELYVCTCLGMPYTVEEIDKCKGWKITQIRIKEDGKYIDLEKGKNNSTAFIPISLYGITLFDNEEDAIKALSSLSEFVKYYYDNDFDDLSYDELLKEYLKFRDH